MRLKRLLSSGIAVALCVAFGVYCIACNNDGGGNSGESGQNGGYTHTPGIIAVGGEGLFEYEYKYFYAELYGEILDDNVSLQEYDEDALNAAKEYKAKAVLARKNQLEFTAEELSDISSRAEQYLGELYRQENKGEYASDSAEEFILLYRGIKAEEFYKIYTELCYGEKYTEFVTGKVSAPSDSELLSYYEKDHIRFRNVGLMTAYFSLLDGEGNVLLEADVETKKRGVEALLSEVLTEAQMSEFVEDNTQIYGDEDDNAFLVYTKGDETLAVFAEFCENTELAVGDKAVLRRGNSLVAVYCNFLEDLSAESVKEAVLEAYVTEKALEIIEAEINNLK